MIACLNPCFSITERLDFTRNKLQVSLNRTHGCVRRTSCPQLQQMLKLTPRRLFTILSWVYSTSWVGTFVWRGLLIRCSSVCHKITLYLFPVNTYRDSNINPDGWATKGSTSCSQMPFFSSCIPAEPPVSSAMRNASCSFYPKIAGACEDIISSRYVYGDPGFLRGSESLNARFNGYLKAGFISEGCQFSIKELACRYLFPLCDTSLNKPRGQGICRKTCQFVLHGKYCAKELDVLRTIAKTDPVFIENLINCTIYPAANGGEASECYQHPALPGDYL